MSAYNLTRGAQSNGASSAGFDLRKGDRVHHKKFGDGLILDIQTKNGDHQLEISFDNVGTRTLMASFAKLTKI